MKNIKFLSIILIFASSLFAYEKGTIDMHGGKGDALNSNKVFSSNFDSLLIKKTKEKKELSEEEKNKIVLEEEKKQSNE